MLKRVVRYSLVGAFVVLAVLFLTGIAVKRGSAGRIGPGVTVWERDLSGVKVEDAEKGIKELLPEFWIEMRCRFLPEERSRIEAMAMEGEGARLVLEGQEVCLSSKISPIQMSVEGTLENILEKSSEVKVWEWLYWETTGKVLRKRAAEPEVVWKTEVFTEMVDVLGGLTEREYKDATVCWEDEKVKVTESERGFRIQREAFRKDTEEVMADVLARLRGNPVDRMVLRFYLKGEVQQPKLSTEVAKECNTVIGGFETGYPGAGAGRKQNIAAGAGRLHGQVILPGETFSVAAALQPFTEANGYAAGGTYINGQLAESIGGGVCQLSSTLYNALLQTKLEITERYPHSMPVGYVPLGQDAAIAGDYKDLKFRNNTKTPVLLLCEATGEEVRIKLYGSDETVREGVSLEHVVTEETEENITVEVYREEKDSGGKVRRERVSKDRYALGPMS